jgi:transposase
MRQLVLPMIPKGATQISNLISVWRDDQRWTYFYGTHPIYYHESKDHRMFRVVTSQLIESGACRPVDIIKTFGVSKSSVDRALKKLRTGGIEAFFKKREGKKCGTVLTKDLLEKAQSLLDQGYSRREVSEEIGIKYDTLRKAINTGRLQESNEKSTATTKSARSVVDAKAADGMGTACTRVGERMLASVGKCVGAAVQFETCLDVPNGGVLCALPALLENGLLSDAEEMLGKVSGYYTVFHILLLLAFMALCRIRAVEQLKKEAPGEFGKILGLDRIPEVRCLRKKLDEMSIGEAAEQWAASLSGKWLENDYEAVGTLYIDGHVRVYNGHLTKLPRRYVSRQRLCLRGTTDYWVNDAIGQPFFMVEKVTDPGLLKTLKEDIVPRLLIDVPNQPSKSELEANPYLSRFVLVFDREGYSPEFFAEMWNDHRISCITYHKHPSDPWPEEWFCEHEVVMPSGEIVDLKLCEMGSLVGSGKNKIWMREVRKLTDSGHQTSVISTAYNLDLTQISGRMFTRWCQENFFRYMMQHFDIDRIVEYGDIGFPDTEKVINPTWRELKKQRVSVLNKLRYRNAKFAKMTLHPVTEEDPKKYEKWVKKKSELLEDIENMERQSEEMLSQLKNTPQHITWGELEENERFNRLLPGRKRLTDTVKMIAYRAETVMTGLLKSASFDLSKSRNLLQSLFVTDADIHPDTESKKLFVKIHGASTQAANSRLIKLFELLNKTETKYPGTDLQLVYELVTQNR